jgi:hypothetical protein
MRRLSLNDYFYYEPMKKGNQEGNGNNCERELVLTIMGWKSFDSVGFFLL